jgi:hypothetical protein
MDTKQPPNTRPIPLPEPSSYSLTETVRERALVAVSFADEFERLLELYGITSYDIYVCSPTFTLHHSNVSEKKDSSISSDPEATPTKSFFFNME